MLEEIWFSLSTFLIIVILARPVKTIGLKTITNNTNLLGPPSRAEKILNNFIIGVIFLYNLILLLIYFKI